MDILSAKMAGQDEESKNVQQQLKESVRSLFYYFIILVEHHLMYLTIIHVKSPQKGKTAKRELLLKDKQIKALESKVKKHIVTCTTLLFSVLIKHIFK